MPRSGCLPLHGMNPNNKKEILNDILLIALMMKVLRLELFKATFTQ